MKPAHAIFIYSISSKSKFVVGYINIPKQKSWMYKTNVASVMSVTSLHHNETNITAVWNVQNPHT